MALGDSRRQSGRQMEQARRQSGADMESQRRALDAQMTAKRRGESVVEDMQRLESPPQVQRSLPTVSPKGGIPAARGRSYYQTKPKLGGGGIAGPLTEVPNSRVYSADETWVETVDGSGLLRVRVAQKLTLRDADDVDLEVFLDA